MQVRTHLKAQLRADDMMMTSGLVPEGFEPVENDDVVEIRRLCDGAIFRLIDVDDSTHAVLFERQGSFAARLRACGQPLSVVEFATIMATPSALDGMRYRA